MHAQRGTTKGPQKVSGGIIVDTDFWDIESYILLFDKIRGSRSEELFEALTEIFGVGKADHIGNF